MVIQNIILDIQYLYIYIYLLLQEPSFFEVVEKNTVISKKAGF